MRTDDNNTVVRQDDNNTVVRQRVGLNTDGVIMYITGGDDMINTIGLEVEDMVVMRSGGANWWPEKNAPRISRNWGRSSSVHLN
ncbi:hypothetical protein [Deinococcus irradiatisoli]|uniref:hypothetical protein n=1 Tax=Deinococcus irradiatisoli TaxID=2202254 RepID=UPI00319E4A73